MTLGVEARRAAARREILQACWDLAAEHGLAGFTLRQVATTVGIRAPSLYSYFDSKAAMYDAMFAEASGQFRTAMKKVPQHRAAADRLLAAARAFLRFCVANPVRHQLLFQRTLPGFEPSPAAYRAAIETNEHMRSAFAEVGITGSRALDLWTGLLAGLAAQQLANEPGGRRWTRLAREATDMYLTHVLPEEAAR